MPPGSPSARARGSGGSGHGATARSVAPATARRHAVLAEKGRRPDQQQDRTRTRSGLSSFGQNRQTRRTAVQAATTLSTHSRLIVTVENCVRTTIGATASAPTTGA